MLKMLVYKRNTRTSDEIPLLKTLDPFMSISVAHQLLTFLLLSMHCIERKIKLTLISYRYRMGNKILEDCRRFYCIMKNISSVKVGLWD